MDDTDLLKVSGFSASTIAIVLIVYRVLKSVMGKKLISSCCGRKIEVGVAVAEMTPKEQLTIDVSNPLHKKPDASVEPDVRPCDRQ